MRDPVPPPNSVLFNLTTPIADALSFSTLPHHVHEVLFSLILYQSIQSYISPFLSIRLFPKIYPQLNRRTKINWDVHVVSLVQSCLINTLALYVMFVDEERAAMKHSVVERIYGYTGASGLIQGFACGYFVWDLVVSTRYFRIFGMGIWAHAVTALCVFSFGFRPFANYYGPIFILYELSSPFLNIHWFCDKLNLTGSKLQWYNGMVLLATFFACRLCWGTYQSYRVFADVWEILHIDTAAAIRNGQYVADSGSGSKLFDARNGQMCLGKQECLAAQSEVMKFATADSHVPMRVIGIYIVSNATLNALNFHWFGKMIETVRKRFQSKPEAGEKKEDSGLQRRKSVVEHAADELDRNVLTGPATPGVEKLQEQAMGMSSAVQDGASEINKRRRDL